MSEADITTGAMSEATSGYCLPTVDVASAVAPIECHPVVARTRWLGELLMRACSFPAVLGAILTTPVYAMAGLFFVDPDIWWHIKTGELILSTHRWAHTDPYSYTAAGAPWMSCEWLGDVFLATVYRLGGLRGLEILFVVLASAVILALYGYATLRSGNCKAAFLVSVILIPLAATSFNLRPQMLGFLFLILTLIALERFRQGKQRAVWALPVLFLIWINTHGSWIIGIGTVVLYIACGLVEFQTGGLAARRWTGPERLRLETVFMLSLAVIPITPYGVQLAAYPFTVASSLPLSVATIQEWRVMPFDVIKGKIFLVLVLGLFLGQVVFRFSWWLQDLLLFLSGTAMACMHVRFLLIFVPFFAPVAATLLARWVPAYDKPKNQYLINFAVMASIAFAMFHYFPSQLQMEEKVADRFPVHALKYLREHPVPGPLYNSYSFGGYMVESGYKTFIDGRSELFEQTGVLGDYLYVTHLKPGALKVLNGYGIQSCLLERGEPLSTVLASLPDWQKVYSDNVSALYVKRTAADGSKQVIATSLSALAR